MFFDIVDLGKGCAGGGLLWVTVMGCLSVHLCEWSGLASGRGLAWTERRSVSCGADLRIARVCLWFVWVLAWAGFSNLRV